MEENSIMGGNIITMYPGESSGYVYCYPKNYNHIEWINIDVAKNGNVILNE